MTDKKYIEGQIEFFKRMVSDYPKVKKVIYEFDGKVYNKRFRQAIIDLNIGLYCSQYRNWLYITESYNSDSLVSYRIPQDLKDGKRIQADDWVEKLTDSRNQFCQKITKYEEEMKTIDQKIEQLEYLKREYKEILNTIPYEIADAYRIERIY